MEYQIVAIKVGRREESSTNVQSILTSFGCSIKVRLGLHDAVEGACSPTGLILLQVSAAENELNSFLDDLNSLEDVTAKALKI